MKSKEKNNAIISNQQLRILIILYLYYGSTNRDELISFNVLNSGFSPSIPKYGVS